MSTAYQGRGGDDRPSKLGMAKINVTRQWFRSSMLRCCLLWHALSFQPMLAMAQAGAPPDPSSVTVSTAQNREVVLALAAVLRERFAFRERGVEAAQKIETLEQRGVFRDAQSAAELLAKIDEQITPIVNDRHFRARYLGPEIVATFSEAPRSAEDIAGFHEEVRLRGGEIPEARWLDGNVGYLRITRFMDAPPTIEKLTAAMTMLADTSALIVDVRDCPGGEPAGVANVIGHFVKTRTPTVRLSGGAKDATEQTFYAEPKTPSFADRPLFILVDADTGSGAEEFAYDLRALGLATLVGQTTAGAATPGGFRPLAHGFVAFIPMQQVANTITGSNWEGVGVVPEVKVPSADALQKAHRLALEAVLKDAQGIRREIAEEGLEALKLERGG